MNAACMLKFLSQLLPEKENKMHTKSHMFDD